MLFTNKITYVSVQFPPIHALVVTPLVHFFDWLVLSEYTLCADELPHEYD